MDGVVFACARAMCPLCAPVGHSIPPVRERSNAAARGARSEHRRDRRAATDLNAMRDRGRAKALCAALLAAAAGMHGARRRFASDLLNQLVVVVCLECSRRHMPEGSEQAPVVVPVHPLEQELRRINAP